MFRGLNHQFSKKSNEDKIFTTRKLTEKYGHQMK
jgi:hypothetical protein